MIDATLLRHVLLDLRVAVDDADAVMIDSMRRPRRRRLGHVTHRTQYREAREKIVSQIAYLLRLTEPDPTPPTPTGGAEH